MTIVDSLKAKGSTGGNNIAEAINNLPSSSGGGMLVVHINGAVFDEDEDDYIWDNTSLDTSYEVIKAAIVDGRPVVCIMEPANISDPDGRDWCIVSPWYHIVNLRNGRQDPGYNFPYIVQLLTNDGSTTKLFSADTANELMHYGVSG